MAIELISRSTAGVLGNDNSYAPSISSDGRFVAFNSEASNLVAGDTNEAEDIFVFDRDSNTIERVSVSSSGAQGDRRSFAASISQDGRFVAFESQSTNLVPGDTNGQKDIFVFDRDTQTIERISINASGVEGDNESTDPSISDNGRFVAFESIATNLVPGDTNVVKDIFVHDRDTDTIERISLSNAGVQSDADSFEPSISSDGKVVAFYSGATNLVSGDTNVKGDTFVFDRDTDTIERVSISNLGIQGDKISGAPSISGDGRLIAFNSEATNLIPGDTNGVSDIFVFDRDTNTIERISVSDSGVEGNGESSLSPISSNGRFVTFHSKATNLVPGDVNSLDTNYEILTIDPVEVKLTDTDDLNDDNTDRNTQPEPIAASVRFFDDTQNDIAIANTDGANLRGNAGNDVLLGQTGQDQLYGGVGDDYLSGGDNFDYLNGNAGDDLLDGGGGNDVMYGSDGNDILNGDSGNDSLFGGDGEDELFGGAGDDTLTGGLEADIFVLGQNRGVDTFEDFSAGFDRINLIDGLTFADLTIEQGDTNNASRILDTATGDVLAILTTTPVNTLAESNFV